MTIDFKAVATQLSNQLQESVQAYISKKERDSISLSDFGWPEERKYPVRNQSDLDAAVKLVGRAPSAKQAEIKNRLRRIAHRKGLSLPETWEA